MQTIEKQSYNLKEAAKYIGIAQNTLRKLIAEGKIQVKRDLPRRVIIPIYVLEYYLKTR